jgi:hypothetical protein
MEITELESNVERADENKRHFTTIRPLMRFVRITYSSVETAYNKWMLSNMQKFSTD